ncbi:hypothetical protein BDM02DRAFT_3264106 [Thelephora ganbajun]|uniref:Uncharacterized protein n=1 Tax=Thelephora ganbajun TaxID=370292 RepID=A0ACB6Z175_THEGA|nr:hypothetical protein BDM02DRAFT_3264106 [Thelephora ganbajun]
MDTQAYPGKGLSLPQLVFALNTELTTMTYSQSLTLDQFSQLTKDILTASAAIHKRRNLLVPINRLPSDVLVLIPMHFASLSDRLRVTFVCRYWRRIFVQHPSLWSQLYLTGRTSLHLVRTLLGRVKASPLDIILNYDGSRIHYVTLLSPLTQQIRSLIIKSACSDEVQELSETISGPLPLLHTLDIDAKGYLNGPRSLHAPTLPLFENAVNLKKFDLDIDQFPSLRHFAFPNLTTLDFRTWMIWTDAFPVSQLLNFLEASPTLQQIVAVITADRFSEDIPPDRVVVLPYIKTFYLTITSYGPGCEITTHISCPSAERAKFEYMLDCAGCDVPEAIYPPSIPLNAIARQYTKGTVEQVVLELTMDEYLAMNCSIAFWSSDGATLKLCYIHHNIEDQDDMDTIFNERLPEVFSHASRTIKDHPLLANVKRLCIRGGNLLTGNLELTTNDVGKLLGSMGPLERLTLDSCDLRPYLDAFLDAPSFPDAIQPASFPPIKELVIIDPVQSLYNEDIYGAAIVELTRSQHTRGVPFEQVKLRTRVPSAVAEVLVTLVSNAVEYYDEMLPDGEDED